VQFNETLSRMTLVDQGNDGIPNNDINASPIAFNDSGSGLRGGRTATLAGPLYVELMIDSRMSPIGRLWNLSPCRSFRLDVRPPDHLAPLLGLIGD